MEAPAAATAATAAADSVGAACWQLSRVIREGFVDYDLKPREAKLAQLLVLESFDAGRLVGVCDFERWAARILPVEAEKGVRADKCKALMQVLHEAGIVDWNTTQSTFELRPYPGYWVLGSDQQTQTRPVRLLTSAATNLPLRSERPLSEAQSELSRERALEVVVDMLACSPGPGDPCSLQGRNQGRATPPPTPTAATETVRNWWQEVKAAIDDPGSATSDSGPPGGEFRHRSQEPGGGEFRHGAVAILATAKGPDLPMVANFATPAIAPIAKLSSCTKAKLSYRPEDALRWLEEQDSRGTLRGRYGPDYAEMCELHAEYVLTKLRWGYEEHLRHYRQQRRDAEYKPLDPVGWIGKRAASVGKMRWRGRKG